MSGYARWSVERSPLVNPPVPIRPEVAERLRPEDSLFRDGSKLFEASDPRARLDRIGDHLVIVQAPSASAEAPPAAPESARFELTAFEEEEDIAPASMAAPDSAKSDLVNIDQDEEPASAGRFQPDNMSDAEHARFMRKAEAMLAKTAYAEPGSASPVARSGVRGPVARRRDL